MMILFFFLSGALILDFLLGDPHSRFHPVALFGTAAGLVERICRRLFGNGILSGLAAWTILVLPVGFLAWGIVFSLSFFACHMSALCVGMVILYFTIALRSLVSHARKIRRPLQDGDLGTARNALSMIVSRDTDSLSESEIVRGGIESLGENLIDAVTSPLFWAVCGYAAAELPGAVFCAVVLRCINTLDACWGYKNERYLRFGRVAAKMDDFAHFIPARLTLPAIALASWMIHGSPVETFRIALRHRKDHPSPNSGYGMSAFAGALGIRLGGPTVYSGETEAYPYWGNGRALLTSRDLFRAEILAVASALCFTALVYGLFFCLKMLPAIF